MIKVAKKLVWEIDAVVVEYEIGDWADLILNNGEMYFGEIIDMQDKYITMKCDNKDAKIYINEIKAFI